MSDEQRLREALETADQGLREARDGLDFGLGCARDIEHDESPIPEHPRSRRQDNYLKAARLAHKRVRAALALQEGDIRQSPTERATMPRRHRLSTHLIRRTARAAQKHYETLLKPYACGTCKLVGTFGIAPADTPGLVNADEAIGGFGTTFVGVEVAGVDGGLLCGGGFMAGLIAAAWLAWSRLTR